MHRQARKEYLLSLPKGLMMEQKRIKDKARHVVKSIYLFLNRRFQTQGTLSVSAESTLGLLARHQNDAARSHFGKSLGLLNERVSFSSPAKYPLVGQLHL